MKGGIITVSTLAVSVIISTLAGGILVKTADAWVGGSNAASTAEDFNDIVSVINRTCKTGNTELRTTISLDKNKIIVEGTEAKLITGDSETIKKELKGCSDNDVKVEEVTLEYGGQYRVVQDGDSIEVTK